FALVVKFGADIHTFNAPGAWVENVACGRIAPPPDMATGTELHSEGWGPIRLTVFIPHQKHRSGCVWFRIIVRHDGNRRTAAVRHNFVAAAAGGHNLVSILRWWISLPDWGCRGIHLAGV